MTRKGKYAVMGNPVGHSKSPIIHRMFAEQFNIPLEYNAILVEQGHFAEAVQEFAAAGGDGLNITVPFKLEAWKIADVRSSRAEIAGAVNTLKIEGSGTLFGDNTDGEGIVKDIVVNLEKPLSGAKVLVIGAGGAVRGVLGPVLAAGPAHLHIINRTASRADELVGVFGKAGQLTAAGLDRPGDAYDVVINGTAASLQGEVPDLPASIFGDNALAYDMMYGKELTPFLEWSRDNGAAQWSDGLGMLVEQAAESFRLWHGVSPDTAPVIRALR
jgi:shikimate dehydrogenase